MEGNSVAQLVALLSHSSKVHGLVLTLGYCVVLIFTCSPHECMDFLWVLQFPLASQNHVG